MNHLTDAVLQAWIDEELDPADRVQVADHLASCTACRNTLGELRATAELFTGALVFYDESIMRSSQREMSVGRTHGSRTLPRWVGRAAAVTLLLGGAAVAAVIPGSPLRELIRGPDATEVIPAPEEIAGMELGLSSGASITVRPFDGRIRIRINGFPAGTRVRIVLTDGALAVANLPDGEPNARFVVAAGLLEVVGPGSGSALQEEVGLILQLPRLVQSGGRGSDYRSRRVGRTRPGGGAHE